MKPRLILCGEIGCGKSTLIRNILGTDATKAGGYVTLRRMDSGKLVGFELAPACALADPAITGQRFLDFTNGTIRNDRVFAAYGASLLTNAEKYPFAVADEFGGLELLVPEFREALYRLLRSDIPCVGVLKTYRASEALAQRMRLGTDYETQYRTLRAALESDPKTLLLNTIGRYDTEAEKNLSRWADTYARR